MYWLVLRTCPFLFLRADPQSQHMEELYLHVCYNIASMMCNSCCHLGRQIGQFSMGLCASAALWTSNASTSSIPLVWVHVY